MSGENSPADGFGGRSLLTASQSSVPLPAIVYGQTASILAQGGAEQQTFQVIYNSIIQRQVFYIY
jgi:hypothetical protein